VPDAEKGGEADECSYTDRCHRDRSDALLRRKIYLQGEEERVGLHRLPVCRQLSEEAACERLLQMTGRRKAPAAGRVQTAAE